MYGVILFISSYVPLYILLMGRSWIEFFSDYQDLADVVIWDKLVFWCSITLCLITLTSLYGLLHYIKELKRDATYIDQVKVLSVQNVGSARHFEYISIYMLSCLGLSLNNYEDVFVLVFVIALVGYIYVKNKLFYINPLLMMLGYNLYQVNVIEAVQDSEKSRAKSFTKMLIAPSKLDILEGSVYKTNNIHEFYLVTREEVFL